METATNTTKTAVIAGATGYLGGHVARAAKRAGYRVRALVRDPAGLSDEVRACCDEVFVGQATDAGTLEGLFDGAHVAFSSVGIRHFRRRPTVWEVDAGANLNLVEAAERAGVGRFVFVSLLGAPDRRHRIPVAEARERVVDRLRAGTMSFGVVRPSGFYNDMLEYLEMAKRGRVWLIGSGEASLNPIHGEDLADACVDVFEGSDNVERDVGGPQVVTVRRIGELAFEALGSRPRFGRVPLWVLTLFATVIYPFNNNLGAFLKMFAVMHEDGSALAPAYGQHTLQPFFAGALGATPNEASRGSVAPPPA